MIQELAFFRGLFSIECFQNIEEIKRLCNKTTSNSIKFDQYTCILYVTYVICVLFQQYRDEDTHTSFFPK